MTRREARRSPIDASESGHRPPHFAGLESIRALAASMVVVHHVASVSGPRAGVVATPAAVMDSGVAVFFVLSGFLIFRPYVSGLVDGGPRPSPVSFWWRRVLRILPAYWLALTVLWQMGSFRLGDQWWRHYLLLQPYDRYTALAGLVPAWSLSTELAFYAMVPPLAAIAGWLIEAVAPGPDRRSLRALILAVLFGAVCLVAPVARATATSWAGVNHQLAFQWLPTNLDLFGAGMLIALVSVWSQGSPLGRKRLDQVAGPAWAWWSGAGVVFLVYAYRIGGVDLVVGYQGWSWQLRQVTFLACSVLLLFPAVFGVQDRGRLRRLWSAPAVVWVGTVSYGVYLWHVGILERLVPRPPSLIDEGWAGLLSRASPPSFWLLLVVTFGGAVTVAAASWYGLERPLQRWKGLLDRG
ncbi:MAG: acyltransferase [Microthrixaceae bacterium]|nr:acyltransferase [Acidimicrobiales bacterium]MCB9404205.1 acyltransferase [Microthrixaceae bacterium]